MEAACRFVCFILALLFTFHLRSSLADLGLDYFDLYIVHWPSGFVPGKGNVPRDEEGNVLFSGVTIEETWGAMEKLVDIGLVRSLGLSNFNSKQVLLILSRIKTKYFIPRLRQFWIWLELDQQFCR